MRVVYVILAVPPLSAFIFLATVFRPRIGVLVLVVSVASWLTRRNPPGSSLRALVSLV